MDIFQPGLVAIIMAGFWRRNILIMLRVVFGFLVVYIIYIIVGSVYIFSNLNNDH